MYISMYYQNKLQYQHQITHKRLIHVQYTYMYYIY